MVVTIVCRDTINCKDTIVLCNGAQVSKNGRLSITLNSIFKPLFLINTCHFTWIKQLLCYMQCLCYNGSSLLFHFFGNIVLSYSELPMIINWSFFNAFRTLAMFLLHYKPTQLWNWKWFWLKAVGYRSVNLFTTALVQNMYKIEIMRKCACHVHISCVFCCWSVALRKSLVRAQPAL